MRCKFAIKFGTTLHTRCMFEHEVTPTSHIGKGLEEFPFQRIEWFSGDRREYETDRDDEFAWEAP